MAMEWATVANHLDHNKGRFVAAAEEFNPSHAERAKCTPDLLSNLNARPREDVSFLRARGRLEEMKRDGTGGFSSLRLKKS